MALAVRRSARVAGVAALLLAPLGPARASDAEEAPAAARRTPYEAATPSERRGRTYEIEELRTEAGDPSFGNHTKDLDDHLGETRPLGELTRPPGPKPETPPREIPGPLRLRRLPGDQPAPGTPLAERLCEAEREHTHASREFDDAVRAYKRARRDEYPRGDAKALVVQRRSLAQDRLARAEQARSTLLDEAADQNLDFDPTTCNTAGL